MLFRCHFIRFILQVKNKVENTKQNSFGTNAGVIFGVIAALDLINI